MAISAHMQARSPTAQHRRRYAATGYARRPRPRPCTHAAAVPWHPRGCASQTVRWPGTTSRLLTSLAGATHGGSPVAGPVAVSCWWTPSAPPHGGRRRCGGRPPAGEHVGSDEAGFPGGGGSRGARRRARLGRPARHHHRVALGCGAGSGAGGVRARAGMGQGVLGCGACGRVLPHLRTGPSVRTTSHAVGRRPRDHPQPAELRRLSLCRGAQDITLVDSGELVLAASGPGVAHPAGFPAWTLLAHLATKLPGDPIRNANLVSVVCAVVTVHCLHLLGRALAKPVGWAEELGPLAGAVRAPPPPRCQLLRGKRCSLRCGSASACLLPQTAAYGSAPWLRPRPTRCPSPPAPRGLRLPGLVRRPTNRRQTASYHCLHHTTSRAGMHSALLAGQCGAA